MKNIDTELSFFHHEDMFLYSAPDYELLEKYSNIVLNDDIDFIRLLRSTDDTILNFKNTSETDLIGFVLPDNDDYLKKICKTEKDTFKIFDEFAQKKWAGETIAYKELFNIDAFELKKFNFDPHICYLIKK